MTTSLPRRIFFFLLLLAGLFFLFSFTNNVFAQEEPEQDEWYSSPECKYSPSGDIDGWFCGKVEIAGDSGWQIGGGSCKEDDQRVDNLSYNTPYNVCCPISEKLCSQYSVRTALCGNAQEVEVKCQMGLEHLSCWGNNYRRCSTDDQFPAPAEGHDKRQGYLYGGGAFGPDVGKAKEYDVVIYNGKSWSHPTPGRKFKVWFCDANVQNCGPDGGETGGLGESRLWFSQLRLVSALTTIAQSLFAPHPSSLQDNSAKYREPSKPATLENRDVITTRIEEHQGANDSTRVVDTATNNSSLVVGYPAPQPLYEFGDTTDDNPYNDDAMCKIPEVFNEPGDDLVGPKITGTLLYTQKHEYTACPSVGCVQDGDYTPLGTGPEACCSYNPGNAECHTDYTDVVFDGSGAASYKCGFLYQSTDTAGKVATFVKSPLIEYVYDKLIVGEDSLFGRFMPEIATGQKFKEVPSSTTYEAEAKSLNAEGASASVKVAEGQGGSPTLYFPHLGSIANYWLGDFQKSLRPQGYGTVLNSFDQPTSGSGLIGSCSTGPPPYCDVDFLLPYFGNNITAATNASQICGVESGGNPAAFNDGCTTGKSVDYSVGLFQINLLAHCPGAFSDFTWDPPSCTVADQAILDQCYYDMLDPIKNIEKAVELSGGGTNWCPWAASREKYCGQCPDGQI